MRKILHAYKLRLTNLSQGNRSLKLGRLSARRDIDLTTLSHLAGKSAEDLLSQIIAGKDVTLIKQLDPRHEPTNLRDRHLNKIFRSARMILEESGTYDLYLGYPFVEGKFMDGTAVRSPLLLFPVRLERNLQGKPRWKLSRLNEPVVFNPTFFLAYETYQSWRFDQEFWEEEVDNNKDLQLWMQELYAKVKQYELAINFNSDLFRLRLEQVIDYRKQDFERFKTGVLKLRPQAVLGIFPQSDSTLLQDYDEIDAAPDQFPLANYLEEYTPPTTSDKPVREEDRYFALPVDSAQEQALLDVRRGKSMVVHGPPGTGKSQLIVNMITDAMAHGQRVLVVSQKRAALDVVYKRLDGLGLSRFAMLVHDHRHDRAEIYQKLNQQILDIETFQAEFRDLNKTLADHTYRRLSRELDQISRKLETLAATLQDRGSFGLSPHELYLSTFSDMSLIDLKEQARKLSEERLRAFLKKITAVRDYREFFQDNYLWKDRLSFRHYQQQDNVRISRAIQALGSTLTTLTTHFQKLIHRLDKNLLSTDQNRQIISVFKRIDRYNKQHNIRLDVEALVLDDCSPYSVKKLLVNWERLIDHLEQSRLLDTTDWQKFEDLDHHLHQWNGLQNKPLRWLDLRFLKARWYLYKLLTAKNISPDPEQVSILQQDFTHFQAVREQYVHLHQRAFFADFPLLESMQQQQGWLEHKSRTLEIWQEIVNLTDYPSLHPVFEHGQWNQLAWKKTMAVIDHLDTFNTLLEEATRQWRLWLSPSQIEQLMSCIDTPDKQAEHIDALLTSFQADFQDLQALDRLLAEFDSVEQQILLRVETQMLKEHSEAEFQSLIRNSIQLHWLEKLEQDHPVLTEVSGRGWNRILREYRETYLKRQPAVASLVDRRLKEQVLDGLEFNRLQNRVTYRDIHHQVKKKRRLWPVRKLIRETWDTGLQKLAPCWLASPESAAAMFPMKADLFDLVIFDEASQCFVERSLPVMLRGKQVVIAGDEQQLPPSDLYKVRYEDDPDLTEDIIPLEVVSVLDLAKQTLEQTRLSWHYRSESEALISFSNQTFYEGSLQMVPPAKINPLHKPAIQWISVQGQWHQNTNEAEAYRVVQLVKELSSRTDNPSVGVVTFNFHQQELIQDLLDQTLQELAENDSTKYDAMVQLLHRVEGEEHQGLFVKNIENVQGDERDIIIFSIAYARDLSGKLQTRFGLLNQAGGENRLNVAVTRARWQIFVVCSFKPEDLNVDNSTHSGPKVFKEYLRYAWEISHGREESSLSTQTDASILRGWLKKKLVEEGFEVEEGLGTASYRLDLAVRRKGEDQYLLGIECEGAGYFNGLSAKEREVYRPLLLDRQNWTITRVWARNVWKDPEKEWERIRKMLGK